MDMDCWQLISDERSFLPRAGNSILPHNPRLENNVVMAGLSPIRSASSALAPDISLSVTHTQLEEKLWNAQTLHSPDMFRRYMTLYVQSLTQNGCIGKLEELISSLYEKNICGLKSDVLLYELLPFLKKEPKCEQLAREVAIHLCQSISSVT